MTDEILLKLIPLWKESIDNVGLGADDDFFEAGGDSLSGVELLAKVSERFGVDVAPLSMYDEASTARGMADLIGRSQSPSPGTAHAD